MEILLQDNLEHQLQPVMAVARVIEESHITKPSAQHRNPVLNELNREAINKVWNDCGFSENLRSFHHNPNDIVNKAEDMPCYQMLDIKMETGTGKTYVYTQTILELHKRCGYNKFIIVVPNLAIKAGTANFIDDPYVKRHFSDVCEYKTEIELCTLEAGKTQKRKKKLVIPTAIRNFYFGTQHTKNKIYVLLMNPQLLTGNGKVLTREDYDQIPGGFKNNAEAIRDCKPVMIIDEPHRMARDKSTYVQLLKTLEPQLVLRYGATFPEYMTGKGKSRHSVKDYVHLLYDLNACSAFNQNLIKGIAKEHVEMPGGQKAEKMVQLTSVICTKEEKSVNLHYKIEGKKDKIYTLHIQDSLYEIDPDFGTLTIDDIKSGEVELSNGVTLHKDDKINPDQYSTSYQEVMIELALRRHFETERQLFNREPARIKTLALFFIDNIESYRGKNGHNDGWLHNRFVELLRDRINFELQADNSAEYESYLQATLDQIEDTCVGYFAQDNQDTDEKIAAEVKIILHGKKTLLSLKDKEGKWNVCRFLFSKWTLKEGWDNPNIFTICKLRSSGSEISKLQEVGRGLRLPVDEAGNRIQSDDFFLNYIVDFTERDFATRLVAEINGDNNREKVKPLEIAQEDILRVAKLRGIDPFDFFSILGKKGFINFNREIIAEKFDDLLKEYPEFDSKKGVDPNRVRNRNSARSAMVGVKSEVFEQLRELWGKLNNKYILFFEENIENVLDEQLPSLIQESGIFSKQTVSTKRSKLDTESGMAVEKDASSTVLTLSSRYLTYNEFLKRASRKTFLPLATLHSAICKVYDSGVKISEEMFNENSLRRLIAAVDDWKTVNLQGLVHYKKANYSQKDTKLTYPDGRVREEVPQTLIGRYCKDSELMPKYLYDALVYDSDLEEKNIVQEVEKVVVYGKIPKSSICIPTVASSNYSPDFMFVVKHKDGSQDLNVIIETKTYEGNRNISPEEDSKINCASRFFDEMRDNGYNIHFRKQINSKDVLTIINELIEE